MHTQAEKTQEGLMEAKVRADFLNQLNFGGASPTHTDQQGVEALLAQRVQHNLCDLSLTDH